jgi:hypothetical protein
MEVHKKSGRIIYIKTSPVGAGSSQSGHLVEAKEFIDCSYEGDLMAMAGVSHTVGRESNQIYHETYNGVQLLDKHQFPDGLDPYKVQVNRLAGCSGESAQSPAPDGSGDNKLQAYNFRLCLTDSPDNRLEITRPADYDSSHYELLLRYIELKNPKSLEDGILNINLMPGRKTDINNNGPSRQI